MMRSTNKNSSKEKVEKLNRGEKFNQLWAILGGLASLVAIIVFITGKENIQSLFGLDDESSPEATIQEEFLFADDFSDTSSGWDTSDDGIAERYYENEEYYIKIHSSSRPTTQPEFSSIYGNFKNAWSIANINNLSDVVIETDVRFVEGSPDEATYGVILNYQGKDNFYYFEISPNGHWDMVQNSGGEFGDLINWQYAPEIRQDKSINHLKIELSKISTLYVNDQLMSSVNLPYKSGGVGFWVASFSNKDVIVAFDNFKISKVFENSEE